MRSDTVRHKHIWNNLPLHFKGLTLLLIPVPALMTAAVLVSGTLREERTALASVDQVVAGRQTLQGISSVLLVPGNPAQDCQGLSRFRRQLGPVTSDPDRLRDLDALIQEKLDSLAAVSNTNSPDSSLWEKNQEATESLQSYINALALEYDQLLATQLKRVKEARTKLLVQSAKGAFVFLLGELLAALVFLGAVTGQIHTLKANSRRLAEGHALLPLFTDNWELNQIGRDLVSASVALNQREREIEAGRALPPESGQAEEALAAQGLEATTIEFRQRNQDLAAALAAARESLAAKGRFLADLSRELRIPLSSILGFSELLYDGKLGAVSEQQKGCLSDVLAGAKRLLQLADSVVGAARADQASAPASPELVDLEGLVKEVHCSLVPTARRKGVRVEISIDPDTKQVKADRGRLKQSFYQCLANAVQFTPHDATLEVRIVPEGSSALRMEVENTGVGMASKDVVRQFPEFQLAAAQSRRARPAHGDDRAQTDQERSIFYAILPGVTRPVGTTARTRARTTEMADKPASTLIH